MKKVFIAFIATVLFVVLNKLSNTELSIYVILYMLILIYLNVKDL